MSVTWPAFGQCADPPYLTVDWIGGKSPTGRSFSGLDVREGTCPQPTSRRSSAWNRQPMLHIASCRLLTKRRGLTEIR